MVDRASGARGGRTILEDPWTILQIFGKGIQSPTEAVRIGIWTREPEL